MSKLEKNHIETKDNFEYSQTGIQCCDNSPSFSITYNVAGVYKVYSVCIPCSKFDFFSKFIVENILIKKNLLKNKYKNSNSWRNN